MKKLARIVLVFILLALSAFSTLALVSATTKLIPKGDLNGPVANKTLSGVIPVWGWFIDGNGVQKIEVLVDGRVMGTATRGIARPDVLAAYPVYGDGTSGFDYRLDTTKLTNGWHKIVIRETSGTGVRTSLAGRWVVVRNSGVLPPMGDLNGPVAKQTLNGTIPVWGWFVDGNGVQKVEILVDGRVMGIATRGIARPDVLSVFPAYVDGTSGFDYRLDTTKLTNGAHKIVIRETSAKGVQTSLAARAVSVQNATPAPTTAKQLVVGYYAAWAAYGGYTPQNIPAAKLTHINYAFANIGTDLKIAMGDPTIDPSNFAALRTLKQAYPSLKTLISVGGWTWSGRFSDVARTADSRAAFADSALAFIKQNGFDGLDLDWEYPVGGGLSTNVVRPEDKQNFTLLLQKIRQTFDTQGVADGKHYLLTIAGGAGPGYANNVELSAIAPLLDFANLMTYDIHGPWDPYTDYNAPLYLTKANSPQLKWSGDAAVQLWKSKGFPTSKIVLGVPFYGYAYSNVQGGEDGLFQMYATGKSVPYDKLASDYLSNSGYTRYFDADARINWAFNGSTMITYDDLTTYLEKVDYVKTNALAGVMIWELSQNKNGELLNQITTRLNQ